MLDAVDLNFFDSEVREVAKKKSKDKTKSGEKKTGKGVGEGHRSKLSNKEYEAELFKLHAELVKLQRWVQEKGLKVIVVFEGRDAAGKGGVIKRITERVSPRVFRVVALPAPTEREKTQMYMQRYIPHFPAAGEVVLFDRSWYNRAGVERVMGFCSGMHSGVGTPRRELPPLPLEGQPRTMYESTAWVEGGAPDVD